MDRKLVFNAIANAVTTYDSSVYVTQKYELIPESVPCVFCQQISKQRTKRYATLCNTDDQHYATYEVQAFAHGLEEAYKLMGVVEAKFKEIGFFEELCTPINNTNKDIDRVVARFSAQQGAN